MDPLLYIERAHKHTQACLFSQPFILRSDISEQLSMHSIVLLPVLICCQRMTTSLFSHSALELEL